MEDKLFTPKSFSQPPHYRNHDWNTVNIRLLLSNSNTTISATLSDYVTLGIFFFYFCPYFAWQQCFISVYNSFPSVGKFIHTYIHTYFIIFEIIIKFSIINISFLFLHGVFSGLPWKIMRFTPFQLEIQIHELFAATHMSVNSVCKLLASLTLSIRHISEEEVGIDV